jgi:hypothetical protein
MLANAILRRIEGKSTREARKIVSETMKDPAAMARLMEKAIQKRQTRSELNKIKNPAVVGGAILEAENQR